MFSTFGAASQSPHYDPDDGPVTVSAAYRAEVRAFLLGEPEPPAPSAPVSPPPVPLPHSESYSAADSDFYPSLPAASLPPAPVPTHRPPTSWYSIADGWHDCPPPKWPLILFDFSRPDEFDPDPVLSDFVYHARDFADCPKKAYPLPDWVRIFLVDSDGNWSDSYVPIDGLPPEHIALIASARSAWNAQHAITPLHLSDNSPSPLTERGSGGEVLSATTPSPLNANSPSLRAERGSGGEVPSFLTDLAPYLSDLLNARPYLLEALAALRAARSTRARRAALSRRTNPPFVGTPFLASALLPASAPPISSTPPPPSACPHPIRPRTSSNPVFHQNNPACSPVKRLAYLLPSLPPKWAIPILPRARPPPRPMNVLAVPPGVFAFGTP